MVVVVSRPAVGRLAVQVRCRACSSSAAAAASRAMCLSSDASATRSSDSVGAVLYYNDTYHVDLPDGHRFPMEKYRLVREMLQQRHAMDGVAFEVSPLATMDELATTHDREYVRRYLYNEFTPRENRVVGFPWSTQSVNRSLSSVGGTVAAARIACARLNPTAPSSGIALGPAVVGHIAGGTHHAFAAHGEGFCVFSDIAVAANVCLEEHGEWLQRVLIIDLDVHQGNGNAVLFEQDPRVFTFSMQCRANLFSTEQFSDRDVFVPDGTGDEGYLAGDVRIPSGFTVSFLSNHHSRLHKRLHIMLVVTLIHWSQRWGSISRA